MGPIRICIFPTDPLDAYVKKGEVKPRYWNPMNVFSEVHVIDFSDRPASPQSVQSAAGVAKLFIHRFDRPGWKDLPSTIRKVRACVEKIRPSVIRAFSPNWVGFIATKIGKKLHIPVAVSIHGNFDETRTGIKGHISSWLEDYTLSRASAVICMTEFLTTYANRHHAGHTDVIYNKVYGSDFNSTVKNEKRKGLLWVGRLEDPKLPELAIHAAAATDQPLTMIGDGEKKQELVEQAKNQKAEVRFIASVPHAQIAKYYRHAKALIMTSRSEGFCIPVLESMASGLPVIASDIPAIAEVSQKSACLVQNDGKAVTNAVERVMSDTRLWKKMQRDGLNRFEQIEGNAMEKKEKKVYERLVRVSA